MVVSSHAQLPPSPPSRGVAHAWREAADYLQLSGEQRSQLGRVRGEHEQQMAGLVRRDRDLRGKRDQQGLQQLCAESRQAHEGLQGRLRALLSAPQLERLAVLEQAFSLMPIVESAQAAGLVSDRLSTAPAGLPQQQVSVDVSFVRAAPAALPGCPAVQQEVRPGMVDGRVDRPLSPSKSPTGAKATVDQRGPTGQEPKR